MGPGFPAWPSSRNAIAVASARLESLAPRNSANPTLVVFNLPAIIWLIVQQTNGLRMETKEKLIETARNLFLQNGYGNTGIGRF